MTTTPNIPSLGQAQSGRIHSILNALLADSQTYAVGGAISDGGTTQATGVGGALNFDADTSAITEHAVNSVVRPAAVAAGTDVDSDAGTQVTWTATSGQAVIYALVAQTGANNDTATAFQAIAGAVAVTGAQVAPTREAIATTLGHSNFLILGDITITRTGDTTVTFAVDYSRRRLTHRLPLIATTEADFR